MSWKGFALYELMAKMKAQHPKPLLREEFPARDDNQHGCLLAVNLLRIKGYAVPAYIDANQKTVGWMLTATGLALWESARDKSEDHLRTVDLRQPGDLPPLPGAG
jgi:hypothetical protein